MILYNPNMANTKSAKKNIRSSAKKKSHNDRWEKRIKTAKKSLAKSILSKDDKKILNNKLVLLQKSLDKAAKEKTIHKNKANRVKSMYARKIAALDVQKEVGAESKPKKPTAAKKSPKRK
jgi:small subunit ribosomal protein S20